MIMVSKLLAARRRLRGTEWDGSYLDHFVQTITRLDARRHGFGGADLSAIEAAWAGEDEVAWSGGFVARLRDGRRGYVDGYAGTDYWGEDAQIEAALLDRHTSHPESGLRHSPQHHAWNEDLARRLNEFLSKVAGLQTE